MPHLRFALLPVAAVTALGLGACGGSDPDSGASADAKAQDAAISFARCMRDHGVHVDDPKGSNSGFHISGTNPTQMQAAQKACQHFLRGASKPPSAAQQAKVRDNALQFARCMRQHGVDFPDPQFQGGKVTMHFGGPGQKADPNDSTLQAAQRACQHFMGPVPKGGPGAGRSTAKGGGGPGFEIEVGPAGGGPKP